jgi:hypothetical protein
VQRSGSGRYLAALSLFGVAAFNALKYLALTTTTALNAALIAASGPTVDDAGRLVAVP